MVIDYKKGKIYKIINDVNDDVYIGSTVNTLSKRMVNHKDDYKKYPDRKLYKFIRDNGGWDHFKIILIEDYPCERKEQLLQREQYYKKIATLNDRNCYGLDKKREKQTKKEYDKEYRVLNKSNIVEKNKKYYKEKGAKINECVCGRKYTHSNKSQHEKTKYHKKYIKQQQEK